MVKVNLATAPIPVFPAFSRHFPLRTGADLAQIWRRTGAESRRRTTLGAPLLTSRFTAGFEREKPNARGIGHAGSLPRSASAMTAAALRRGGAGASDRIIWCQDGVVL